MTMANPALGAKMYFQCGLESTWATAVAATHRFGVLGFGFTPDAGLAEDNTQTGSANTPPSIPTVQSAGGWLEMIFDYEVLGILLDWAYGTATFGSAGESVSGAGPYVHTVNDSKTVFNSLTGQFIEGDVPTGKCARAAGMKCSRMNIRAASDAGNGAVGIVRFEWVAKGKEYNVTPTALSASTRSNVTWPHLSTLNNGTADATADQAIVSIDYTLENPLTRQATGRTPGYIDEPILNGARRTSLRLVQRMHTKTLQDAYLAGTDLTPAFTFTKSASNVAAFTFPKARLASPPDPDFSGYEMPQMTLDYQCHDGGSYASRLQLTNSKATILTP